MSLEDVRAALQETIADLQSQVKELKCDKEDLRADKDGLKADVARRKDELQVAMSEMLRLNNELQAMVAQNEELRKENKEFKEKNAVTRSSRSTQTDEVVRSTLAEDRPTSVEGIVLDHTSATGIQTGPAESELDIKSPSGQNIPRPLTTAGKRKADDLEASTTQTEPPRKRGRPRKAGIITVPPRLTNETEAESSAAALVQQPAQGRSIIAIKMDEAFFLPEHDLAWRLEDIASVANPTPASSVAVSRDFLSHQYGGSHCHSVQYIKADQNPSGNSTRAFAFPRPDLNPHMPVVVGQSGVVIGNHCEKATDQSCTSVFSASDTAKVYIGEYVWERGEGMSAAVFRGQSDKVKANWAAEVLGEKRSSGDSQAWQRARIALRKAGLLPQDTLALEKEMVRQELERIKMGDGHQVEKRDIVEAFERGEEVVPVTRLRFLSYDTTLATDIKTRFEACEGSRRRSKRKSAATGKKGGVSIKANPGPSGAPGPDMRSADIAHFDPESYSISVGPTTQGGPWSQKMEERGEDPTIEGAGYLSYAAMGDRDRQLAWTP